LTVSVKYGWAHGLVEESPSWAMLRFAHHSWPAKALRWLWPQRMCSRAKSAETKDSLYTGFSVMINCFTRS